MPRILVVDDEPLIAMLLREWLEELGCETVGPVHSVRAALDLIDGAALDGAILDVSLGSENCYPIADALFKLGVPIAFATGRGNEAIDARFMGAPVLSKPFGFEAVRDTVSKLAKTLG